MTITMYDSIYVGEIPTNAQAVAGYTAGRWPTYPVLVQKFPKAQVLSIAVASRFDAECLDIEPGDATIYVAAGWVKRQQARGVKKPKLYISVSGVKALLDVLAKAGIKRTDIHLWTAHYTGKPHLCDSDCGFQMPTTADATQYTNHALGRTLDASLCTDAFLGVEQAHPAKADKRKAAAWRHHLHELQDVGRLYGWSPAMKVAAAQLRNLLRRR